MGKSLLEFQSTKGEVLPPHKVIAILFLLELFRQILCWTLQICGLYIAFQILLGNTILIGICVAFSIMYWLPLAKCSRFYATLLKVLN